MRGPSNDSIVRYCRLVFYQRHDGADTMRAHKLDANARPMHSAASSVVHCRDQDSNKHIRFEKQVAEDLFIGEVFYHLLFKPTLPCNYDL